MTSNEEKKHSHHSMGCGVLGRHPILSVISFASVGVAIGVGLSYWDADDEEQKDNILKWIGLVGDLFIRSLKAVVLPLVFTNVVVSVVDMIGMGRASSVGWKTIGFYTMTTVIASTIGVISILCFKNLFDEGTFDEPEKAYVQLGCNAPDSFITEIEDGELVCTTGGVEEATNFEITDLTGSFVQASSGARDDLSISDTIYEGVFMKLVTSNIFHSFVDGNFAAVVIFAIAFGVALGKVVFGKRKMKMEESSVVILFQELSELLLLLIEWIISLTPFAVLSLIADAIGSQDDLSGAFANVGYLIAAAITGFVVHFIFTDILLFWLLSGWNPFEFLQYIIPAQMTAFACSSSAATLPVTLECVKETGKVPDDIRNFVLPLGATVNMDGSAIYFPCACIWLAVLNGITPNFADFVLLIILSTVGSAGAAPVPSAGLVLVITAYNTVFGGSGTPNGFEFIVAIDWFLDRWRTALNVTGDTVVAAITAARTPLEEEEMKEVTGMAKDKMAVTTVEVASSSEDSTSSPEEDAAFDSVDLIEA